VRRDVERFGASLKETEGEEARLSTDIEMARAGIVQNREASFAAERESVELQGRLREVRAQLDTLNTGRMQVASLRQRFEEEVREGITLVGAAVHAWDKMRSRRCTVGRSQYSGETSPRDRATQNQDRGLGLGQRRCGDP